MTPALLFADVPTRWIAFAVLATAAGLLAARLAGSRPAAVRHGYCFLALVATLAAPVATLVAPKVEVLVGVASAPGAPAGVWGGDAATGPQAWLLVTWLLVAVALMTRVLRHALAVDRLRRSANDITARNVTRALRCAVESVGLRRAPRVVTHPGVTAPAAWGLLSDVVFLPSEAATWSPARLRAVLLHECAHLARRDTLSQLVADAACAVWWFVPFAWCAARRMRREREIACDDRVVAGGARPSGYARMLVHWVRSPAPRAAAALGGRTELEARVRSLLSPRGRRRAATPDERALAVTAAVVAVALAATLTPVLRPVRPAASPPETARRAPSAALAPARPEAPPTVRTEDPRTPPSGVSAPAGSSFPADAAPAPPQERTAMRRAPPGPQRIARAGRPRGGVPRLALERALGSVGDALGGALRLDDGDLVLDERRLKRHLGLPDDAAVHTVVAPLGVVSIRVGR